MTKILEQIISREFEARDARLRESQPKREATFERSAKRWVAQNGGTVESYKETHHYYAERRQEWAYRTETKRAIADAVSSYLDKNPYVVSSTIQKNIDTLCDQESSKRDGAIRREKRRQNFGYKERLKYRTEEAESANPSRNPYFKHVVDYMPLAEAVRLAAGLGRNVEVNTKGNRNDTIYFKDRKKMLQALKKQIKGAPREIKMQFDLGLN